MNVAAYRASLTPMYAIVVLPSPAPREFSAQLATPLTASAKSLNVSVNQPCFSSTAAQRIYFPRTSPGLQCRVPSDATFTAVIRKPIGVSGFDIANDAKS
ncbi:hypothetical protein KC338_g56 [Hortaea werneckii]|nr:hypothetical protein KC338_g56 [Hortaea werneckii]